MDTNRPVEDACAQEQQNFRRKAARLQFFQSVFQGIGGASLFGLVSSLILGGGAVAATLPLWALAAIPVFGIGMIFIGTRCGIESQLLSQSLGAAMMGKAIKQPGAAPAPEVEQEKTKALPPGMEAASKDAAEEEQAPTKPAPHGPGHQVHAIAAMDRIESPAQGTAIH